MSLSTHSVSAAGKAPDDPRPETVTSAPRRGISAWILYAASVLIGLIVSLSSLLTVLFGQGAPGVGIAAAVALLAGLALSVGVAPVLRRRAPAMLTSGCGAGLMAGGVMLGSMAAMIALA